MIFYILGSIIGTYIFSKICWEMVKIDHNHTLKQTYQTLENAKKKTDDKDDIEAIISVQKKIDSIYL